MVTQKKTTTIKRSRHSLAMTPLTRQVMTKSIHRAVLEYQHSQHGAGLSPKSPLDLRVRRDGGNATKPNHLMAKLSDKSCISTVTKSTSMESRMNPLETVYEQDKDANADASQCIGPDSFVCHNFQVVQQSNQVKELLSSEPIGETPVLVSRKLSNEKMTAADGGGGGGSGDHEVWYTPKEFVQTKVVENIEVSGF